jgi:hypothetical protein
MLSARGCCKNLAFSDTLRLRRHRERVL